jgi:lysyl-tRNA synthetase, class II
MAETASSFGKPSGSEKGRGGEDRLKAELPTGQDRLKAELPTENPQFRDRMARVEKWRAAGVDPYGRRTDGLMPIGEARRLHKGVDVTPHDGGEPAKVAGRIVLCRDIGKLIFITIQDWTGRIQIGLAKQFFTEATDAVVANGGRDARGTREGAGGAEGGQDARVSWAQAKLLELGDVAWFEGKVGHTKTGEVTVWASGFGMLSKALLPPPDKFHGLHDTETRYRQRYVDLFANPDSMDVFLFRCRMIESIRDFLKARQFVEVETPMMQSIAGGAAARPFITHHNALDIDLYMRISPELYLKRLLVGGMERVFEINRNFRNEGIDTTHNPEFTMMEVYQAYSDLAGMMELTESLVVRLAKERVEGLRRQKTDSDGTPVGTAAVQGGAPVGTPAAIPGGAPVGTPAAIPGGAPVGTAGALHLQFGERILDFTPPFERLSYAAHFKDKVGVDMTDAAAVQRVARERGINTATKEHDVVVGELFEQLAEPALKAHDRPVFIYDYPAALCPLTRRKPGDPRIAERFELYVAGMELANAYTELNDPAVQEETFSKQLAGQKEEESMAKMDEDFIAALRYGMPPAGGLGIGIDRLAMVLTNRVSIRDVVLFPLLKPTEEAGAGAKAAAGKGGPTGAAAAPRGGGPNFYEVDEEQMEKDVAKIESDLAKVKAIGPVKSRMFILNQDGSLRIFDV